MYSVGADRYHLGPQWGGIARQSNCEYSVPASFAARVGANIYTSEHRKLSALLRSLREEAGLTQVQLAARLRRSQSFVSKYEAGQRRLDLVDLRRVARAVGLSLPEVVARYEAALARSHQARRTRRAAENA